MIELKNTYLGYTDNLKPMQKAKIEKVLNELIRYDKIIHNQKEFILNKLKEGYLPYIEENYSYYSSRLEDMTKPKDDYRLTKENSYYTINKTLYNFAIYIIDKNLTDDTIRENFIATEQQKIKRQEQIKKEKELQEQQEKELKEKQEQEYKNWMESEIKTYNNINKFNLAKEIFLHEIGNYSEHQLKKLLILIENIDNSLCKENLISWLHSGNKTSKKVFYHVTGIKLSSTDKATKPILENLTSKDYISMVEYKPRKQSQKKELKTFYQMIRIPEPHFQEVLGEEIIKYGLTMFLSKENKYYHLTEAKSGCTITSGGKTKEEVFKNLKSCIDKNEIEAINNLIQQQITKTGLSPLYQKK